MEELIKELVFEATHQVDSIHEVKVRPHCYDDGKNKCCLAVEVWPEGKVFIGYNAIRFLIDLDNALREVE